METDPLIETWQIHNRINLFMLDAFSALIGYLISHESHHRGQIILILKKAGHPVDRQTGLGNWEWGVL